MRAVVCALAALALLPGGRRAPAVAAPAGHDHGVHAGQVALAGAGAVPCARCHPVDRRGRVARQPGHAACFGDCHGPAPRRWQRPDAARRAVCAVCHEPAALDHQRPRPGQWDVPAGPLSAPEHDLRMSHAAHDGPSLALGGCVACHARPGDDAAGHQVRSRARSAPRARAGHERCTSCHAPAARAGAEPGPPSMQACARCHVPVDADLRRPRLAPGPFPVDFSHARHAARGLSGCRDCHAAVRAATGNALPAPRTEQCAGCHDGARAFSVVTPHCRRCHTRPGPRQGLRPPRGPGYSHRAHRARGLDLPCTACHQLDARGLPLPPAADHAPCSDAGCHRDDFEASEPRVCGACHLGTDPWLRLYFEPRPRPDTELGARFSHRAHARAGVEACEGCHQVRSRLRDLRLPSHHQPCMGAGCHLSDAAESPAPAPLAACETCHVLDLVSVRRGQRLDAPWSVRARFDHASHRTDPGTGAAVPCRGCHVSVLDTDGIADIPGPPKRACEPCHDGRAAFDITGHGCARCHGPGS